MILIFNNLGKYIYKCLFNSWEIIDYSCGKNKFNNIILKQLESKKFILLLLVYLK